MVKCCKICNSYSSNWIWHLALNFQSDLYIHFFQSKVTFLIISEADFILTFSNQNQRWTGNNQFQSMTLSHQHRRNKVNTYRITCFTFLLLNLTKWGPLTSTASISSYLDIAFSNRYFFVELIFNLNYLL